MWLTIISFILSVLWLWFHDTLESLDPHSGVLADIIVSRTVGTTILVYAASWLLKRFRTQRLDAKKSLNSGC